MGHIAKECKGKGKGMPGKAKGKGAPGKAKGKGKASTQCYNCGKYGHIARDCKGKGKNGMNSFEGYWVDEEIGFNEGLYNDEYEIPQPMVGESTSRGGARVLGAMLTPETACSCEKASKCKAEKKQSMGIMCENMRKGIEIKNRFSILGLESEEMDMEFPPLGRNSREKDELEEKEIGLEDVQNMLACPLIYEKKSKDNGGVMNLSPQMGGKRCQSL